MRRPASYWDVVGAHLPGFLIAGLPLAAAVLSIDRWSLHACLFRRWTGMPCAFCGYTRATVLLAHGRWAAAIADCPLSVVVFAGLLLVFAWSLAGLSLGMVITRGRWLKPQGRTAWILGAGLGLLVLLNWTYRLIAGLQ